MHAAKKYFGQNFLEDEQVIERIIHCIHLKEEDHVLEIGPGRGALTGYLFQRAHKLSLVEIDRDLIPQLEKLLHKLALDNTHQWQIFQQDVLTFQLQSLQSASKLRVVGNLPYNISTPLLFHLLKQIDCIADMHFMLQKEVVERICAKPDNKDYGRLSIMLQYYCEASLLFDVPPESFNPKPKVDSAILRLQPHSVLPYPCTDVALLEKLVAAAFSQRRKTIRNTLKKFCEPSALEAAEIDAGLRPENISVAEYVRLCNILVREPVNN